MARSLMQAAYLALRRGGTASEGTPPARPDGLLLWVHCADPARLGPIATLIAQIIEDRMPEALHVVLTVQVLPDDLPHLHPRITLQRLPADLRASAQGFLAQWRPDLLVWTQGILHPVLLAEVAAQGIPALLVDISAESLSVSSGSWVPGVMRGAMSAFERCLAVDAEAEVDLRKAGMPGDRIETVGPFDIGDPVLTCSNRERDDLSKLLNNRPVWLAAQIAPDEIKDIVAAHKQACRRAHRLLLIVVPQQAEDAAAFTQTFLDAGFNIANRQINQEPDEATSVYISDSHAEMGLWFRLAPLTFMGGTFQGGGVLNPFAPAALGSVVVHGPKTELHDHQYKRLAKANASHLVRVPAELGSAVETMLAPDIAATMAHAAWDVTSSGAEAANRVTELINDRLDKVGG